jgi:hypothetical protein
MPSCLIATNVKYENVKNNILKKPYKIESSNVIVSNFALLQNNDLTPSLTTVFSPVFR